MFIFRIILSYRLSYVFHMFSSIHHSFVCIPRPPILDLDFLSSLVWSIKLLWSIYLYSWVETQCYCFNTTFGLHPTGWSILADFWVFLKMFEASPTCWIESHQITFTWTPPVSTNFLLLFFGSTTKRPPPRPKPSDGASRPRQAPPKVSNSATWQGIWMDFPHLNCYPRCIYI